MFGTPTLLIDNLPFDFRLRKGKALLAVLAAEEGQNSRDYLATMLWPDFDQVRARTNLRRTLSRINQTPFSRWIEADSEHIALNPGDNDFIDLREFSRLLADDQIDSLQRAVDLYQDDFLSDFYLGDTELFENWSVNQREFFRRQVLDSLHKLIEIYTKRQEYRSATVLAFRQLEMDKFRESAWRQLMQVQALAGQRIEAINTYENLKDYLNEELGLPPSSETNSLYESIRSGTIQSTTKIQGYEIREKIGEGSFGTVYRAYQPTVERIVAVKEINPVFANQPEFIRRFEAEAHLIASLEHPHIVPIYDYWREPDRAYIVMRYLGGENLKTRLQRKPFQLLEAVQLIEDMASGLMQAHRQGIVHGNLNPANILLDETGNAYLSDFGIALNVDQNADEFKENQKPGWVYVSPEQLNNQPVSSHSDIFLLGLILWEMLVGKPPFSGNTVAENVDQLLHEKLPPLETFNPDLPKTLSAVIHKMTAKKKEDRYADLHEMVNALHLAAGLQTVSDERSQRALVDLPNPYRGLRAYTESDAELFFGREKSTGMLVEHLKNSQLLCVIGPSGIGKSSLTRAGLLPAVRNGEIPGSENWFITEMVPGTHPFEELEAALLRISSQKTESLMELLRRDERGLIKAAKRILPQSGGELLVVIDQFEELFTLVEDEASRRKFLNNLVGAAEDQRSRIRVVLVLRADFYGQLLLYQEFGELLHKNSVVVLPPSKEELAQVITSPAELAGVTVEQGLRATMIADVLDQPSALPLLQYTLTELFNSRANNRMTLVSYESIGGISGALGKRAEELFNRLEPEQQALTRQIFLRLANINESAEVTRRRTLRSELMGIRLNNEKVSPDSVNQVIDLFGQYRLLTLDHQAGTRKPTVEVAHEALLNEWPRLKNWLSQNRDDLYQQQLLGSLTSEWKKADKSSGHLLRGARLDQFAGWAETKTIALTESELEFLETSLAAREERQEAEERRRQQELETAKALAETQAKRAEEQENAARMLQRRAYYLFGALSIAIILAVSALVFGQRARLNAADAAEQAQLAGAREEAMATLAEQARLNAIEADENAAEADANAAEAVEQAQLATSRELAMAALNELEVDPERSALLAIQSLSSRHTIEAEEALHQALQNMRITQRFEGHQAYLNSVAYSPDGSLLTTASGDGTAKIWNRKTGEVLLTISSGNAEFYMIRFHPAEPIIATGDSAGFIRLWDAETGAEMDAFSLNVVRNEDGELVEGSGDGIQLTGLAFSPNGDRLAAGNYGGTIKVWDLYTGAEILLPEKPGLTDLTFHPDGLYIAVSNGVYPGYISILNTQTSGELFQVEAGLGITGLTFNPVNHSLVSTGYDGNLTVWDPLNGEVLMSETFGAEFYSPVFSPDGQYLAIAHPNGTAIVLNAETLEEIITLAGHSAGVNSVAFSPDGDYLATASNDGTALEWSLKPGYEVLTIGNNDGFLRVAYHPSGKQLATTSLFGMVSVWDAQTGALIWQQKGHDQFVGGLAYCPDGSLLASSSDVPPVIIVWDAATGDQLITLEGHTSYVNNIAFSPDGEYIASAGEDNTARIWNMDGEVVAIIDHPEHVWGLAFHPDGSILSTSPWNDTAVLEASSDIGDSSEEQVPDQRVISWDYISGVQVLNLGPHSQAVRDLDYSSDGDRLAAGSWDGTVTVWNVHDGEQLLTFDASNHTVFRLAFSPDNTQIATSGLSVKVWDSATGERLLTFENHTAEVYDLAFSPDGKYLATASLDGTVRIQVLNIDALIELATDRLTRGWTEAECQQFLHLASCPPVEEN